MKELNIAAEIINAIMVISAFIFAIFAFYDFFSSYNLRFIMSIIMIIFSVAALTLNIYRFILNRKRKE